MNTFHDSIRYGDSIDGLIYEIANLPEVLERLGMIVTGVSLSGLDDAEAEGMAVSLKRHLFADFFGCCEKCPMCGAKCSIASSLDHVHQCDCHQLMCFGRCRDNDTHEALLYTCAEASANSPSTPFFDL